MGCLGCELINVAAVKLRDGREVCSSCPDHRLECEAREVLKKPLEQRQEYLKDVDEKRGKRAGEELRAAIKVEWEKRK
jgi:hypothetical protein